MLGLDIWSVCLYIINVIILFFILRWLLYKPVSKYLEGRQRRIDEELAEIERREADAATLKSKYEGLINDAQDQAADIINKGNEMSLERSREIVDDAKEQARQIVLRAHSEIEQEKKIAQQEMKEEIVDMAVQMAERMLKREVSKEDNQKIIDEFFEKVG